MVRLWRTRNRNKKGIKMAEENQDFQKVILVVEKRGIENE